MLVLASRILSHDFSSCFGYRVALKFEILVETNFQWELPFEAQFSFQRTRLITKT